MIIRERLRVVIRGVSLLFRNRIRVGLRKGWLTKIALVVVVVI